jgi:DNA repair exonuclease SbcCD ATPase subunit
MADKSLLEQTFKDHQQRELKTAEVRANYNKIREMLMPLQPYAEFDCECYEQKLKAYQDAEAERNKYLEQLGKQRQTVMRYHTEIAEAEQAGVYEQSEIDKASDILRVHENAVARMPDLTRATTEEDTIVSEAKNSLEAAESQNKRAAKGKEIVRILNKVRTLLHNDNLPRMLVNDALNTLNAAMSRQLEEFGFLYNVKWLPGGVLVFENEIGDDVPVRSLSGGQQYVVLIALRCALVQMLGSTFPLFVLDEPTTGLDEKNREALARVLPVIGEALSSYVSTVVVPTHDEALLGTANLIKIED